MTMTIENLHEIPSELYNAVLSQVQGVQNNILAQSGTMYDRGDTLVAAAQDAIRRIDDGTYGACETCGGAVERARLKALPFAKKCMGCQNAAERGRSKFRPFGGTLPLQQLAAEEAGSENPDSMG